MKKKKIWKIGLLFLLVLGIAGFMEKQKGELIDGIFIERNEPGDGKKKLTLELEAEDLNLSYEYPIEIEEILFTEEEAQALMDEVIEEIDDDFSDVKDVVPLKKSYKSGLVEVTWKFDMPECMDVKGNIIKAQIPEDGLLVNAQADLECQNYKKIYSFPFIIPKQEVSDSEKILEDIAAYIDTEQKKEGTTQIQLPEAVDGVTLTWSEKEDYLIWKILLLEVIAAVLLVLSEREKKKEEIKRRKESMELDYPEIVGQMTILLGSGMTISQAWNIIATRYLEKRQKNMIESRPAYEEIALTNHRMKEGETEREAFMQMENRISLIAYHRFIRILLNNKSKGGRDLCQSLEQEAAQAYEQRTLIAKKKGEEASTRMLLPLMLMMVLVMAIVILPAIIEFKM